MSVCWRQWKRLLQAVTEDWHVLKPAVLALLLFVVGVASEAPTTLQLQGKPYHLKAFAWRDFMPQIGGDGKGSDLMVTVSLVDAQEQAAPGVKFDQLVVRCDGQEWKTTPDSGGTGRGGPKWPVGSSIMVKAHCAQGWIRLEKPGSIGRTD